MRKYKIALITGITGQDGSYLAEFLLGKIILYMVLESSSLNTKELIIYLKILKKKS